MSATTPDVSGASQDFSLDRLKHLFELDHGHVFWRHDVDYNPYCAVKMAEFEADYVSATFYVRTAMLESELVMVAEAVEKHGHKLGAHVDLGLPREAIVKSQTLQEACFEQSRALRQLGLDVGNRVSFHAPPHDVLYRSVRGFEHAMSPRWQAQYVADSRGFFRVEVEKFIESHDTVQVNLHPEWWFLPLDRANCLRWVEAKKP